MEIVLTFSIGYLAQRLFTFVIISFFESESCSFSSSLCIIPLFLFTLEASTFLFLSFGSSPAVGSSNLDGSLVTFSIESALVATSWSSPILCFGSLATNRLSRLDGWSLRFSVKLSLIDWSLLILFFWSLLTNGLSTLDRSSLAISISIKLSSIGGSLSLLLLGSLSKNGSTRLDS